MQTKGGTSPELRSSVSQTWATALEILPAKGKAEEGETELEGERHGVEGDLFSLEGTDLRLVH